MSCNRRRMYLYVKVGTLSAAFLNVVRRPKYEQPPWPSRYPPTVGDRCVVDLDGAEVPILIDGRSGDLLLAARH